MCPVLLSICLMTLETIKPEAMNIYNFKAALPFRTLCIQHLTVIFRAQMKFIEVLSIVIKRHSL